MGPKPHPRLIPLLEKYDITYANFCRRGRLPKRLRWVLQVRSSIVTTLHLQGTPWKDMIEITGLSLGSIERLTKAMWNEASRSNRVSNAARQGRLRKGEKKPWLTLQMKKAWEGGLFSFHGNRKRSAKEIEKLRSASLRPEVKALRSQSAKARWQNPNHRDKLLNFHRHPDQVAKKSRDQTKRMQENPSKWVRGKSAWCLTKKGGREEVWTRSSYERAAILVLDKDDRVVSYDVERKFEIADRHILPDFIVRYSDGVTVLVEVKASWVLKLPSDHKIMRRLGLSRSVAVANGWDFEIWTEKDRLAHVVGLTKD